MSGEEKHPYEKFLEGGEEYAKHLERGEHNEADAILAKRNEDLKKARIAEIEEELQKIDIDYAQADESHNQTEIDRLKIKNKELLLERAQLTGEKKDRS